MHACCLAADVTDVQFAWYGWETAFVLLVLAVDWLLHSLMTL